MTLLRFIPYFILLCITCGVGIYAWRLRQEILKREQAEEALRCSENQHKDLAERLTRLRAIDKSILAAESPELIAQAVLEQLSGIIACDQVSVVVSDDDMRPGETRASNDLSAESQLTPIERNLQETGEHAYVSVPLKAKGEIIGALNLSRKVPGPFAPEELGAAQEIVGLMAVAIQRLRLLKQVQERADFLEQRVQRQATQLEAANHELEVFAYSVSHDLRAPLRGLDGYSHALLEDYGPQLDEMAKAYLHYISDASRQMASQIDDLLRLSRIMRSEIAISQVDLSGMVTRIANQLQSTQPERLVTFAITPGLQAEADVDLIKLLLTNLLDNAWKFTSLRANASIEFGITEKDGKTVYFVRDDGAGFNEAYQDKLFLPFHRLHAAHEFEGSGIGLAIVERIVKRHGGSVWAEGEEGKGATFYFTLQGDAT